MHSRRCFFPARSTDEKWLTSGVPELRRLATTMRYWQTEICNYATYRITNSITEAN
ncbi:MAG: transposase [Bacillota bacterium]